MNIREISKLAGVSPAAVSIVINNRKGVSASTREHVKRIMEQYNYHPQERGSKNKKSSAETNKILFLKHRKAWYARGRKSRFYLCNNGFYRSRMQKAPI